MMMMMMMDLPHPEPTERLPADLCALIKLHSAFWCLSWSWTWVSSQCRDPDFESNSCHSAPKNSVVLQYHGNPELPEKKCWVTETIHTKFLMCGRICMSGSEHLAPGRSCGLGSAHGGWLHEYFYLFTIQTETVLSSFHSFPNYTYLVKCFWIKVLNFSLFFKGIEVLLKCAWQK